MEAHYFGPDETDIVVTKTPPDRRQFGQSQDSGKRVIVSISEGFSDIVSSEIIKERIAISWAEYEQLTETQKKQPLIAVIFMLNPRRSGKQLSVVQLMSSDFH